MKAHGWRLFKSTNQTLTSGVDTKVTFDTREYDSDGFWASGSPTIVTVPAGMQGLYLTGGNISMAASATGARYTSIYKNGATEIAGGSSVVNSAGDTVNINMQGIAYLNAGDTLEMRGYQASGGNKDIVSASDYSPVFWGVKLGE